MSLCTLRKFFLLRLLEINTTRKATPVTIAATIMNIRVPTTAPAIEELSSVSPVVVVCNNSVTIDEVVPSSFVTENAIDTIGQT